MILCDDSLKELLEFGLIKDNNYEENQIQPASIDLRINETITVPANGVALASTIEYIRLPTDYAGRVEGRSSYGRLFLMIHSCAGYVDPGFDGNITLEIVNFNNEPYTFKRGERVCQLVVEQLDKRCSVPYGDSSLGSHYQGQTGIRESYLQGQDDGLKNFKYKKIL